MRREPSRSARTLPRVRELVAEIFRGLLAAVAANQYLTLFGAIAVEEAGVPLPVPGDLLIAYFGWRAALDPTETAKVILICAAASTVGTQAPYWIARRFGRRVAVRATFWLDIDPKDVERLFTRVQAYGFRGVLVARLIPGLRVAVSLAAGTARVPPVRFASAVFIAASLYWTGWVLLGATLGPKIAEVVSPAYLRVIVVAIPVVFVTLFVGRILWARRRRSRA